MARAKVFCSALLEDEFVDRIAANAQRVICIDLGGTNFKAGVVSESGCILHRIQEPTPAQKRPETVLAVIGKMIEELENVSNPCGREQKQGVSIGVPGIVDRSTGEVTNCFNVFGHNNQRVSLKRDLESLTGRTIRIDKDLNLAALGEHWMGAGKGYCDILCTFVGTGIGSGLILDNQIYRGALGAAGEIGHLTMQNDGPKCGCGNTGCLEQFASGPAILRCMLEEMSKRAHSTLAQAGSAVSNRELTTKGVFDLARQGDESAVKVIDKACSHLGIGLANVLTLLNPALVIIGGGVGRQFDIIIGRIWTEIRRRCRPSMAAAVKIVPSVLWDDAALLGGARYYFQEA
jgi:glucokinase